MPVTSHPNAPRLLQPSPHRSMSRSLSASKLATVHRTEPEEAQSPTHMATSPTPRGKRTLDDLALLALQVRHEYSVHHTEINRIGLEPHVLFPESCTPPTPINLDAQIQKTKEKMKSPMTIEPDPSQLPKLNCRIKTTKKTNGINGLSDLDVQSFVDVPLQHAEGTEILALIGAIGVHIPSQLIISSHEQINRVDPGQSSRAQPKRKKTRNSTQGQDIVEVQIQEARLNGLDRAGPMLNTINFTTGQDGFQPDNAQQDNSNSTAAAQQKCDSDEAILATEDIDEDPYLNQVDYSDDDI